MAHLAVTANRPDAHSAGRSQELGEQRSPDPAAQGSPQMGHCAAGLRLSGTGAEGLESRAAQFQKAYESYKHLRSELDREVGLNSECLTLPDPEVFPLPSRQRRSRHEASVSVAGSHPTLG